MRQVRVWLDGSPGQGTAAWTYSRPNRTTSWACFFLIRDPLVDITIQRFMSNHFLGGSLFIDSQFLLQTENLHLQAELLPRLKLRRSLWTCACALQTVGNDCSSGSWSSLPTKSSLTMGHMKTRRPTRTRGFTETFDET